MGRRKEQLAVLKKRRRVGPRPSAAGEARQAQAARSLQRLSAGRASSNDILTLQRCLGNAVVQRALENSSYAMGLMRSDKEAAGAVETPARQRLQELTEVDIGQPGEAEAWSATPPMTAVMVTTMEIATLLEELHPAQASQVLLQLSELLEQAEETAEAMTDAAEQETARRLIAAAAAMATAVLALARLSSRVEPRQMRTLATALSAYDPLPAKLLAVEAGKAAQTEAELVGLSQLVGTAHEAMQRKLEKARSQYKGNEALLMRLLSQFQQNAEKALKPALWRT